MRLPSWTWIVCGVLLALGVLLFFQTRDPLILIFALMGSGMFLAVMAIISSASGLGGASGHVDIRVKCGSCGALNLADAKFCSQCGRAL